MAHDMIFLLDTIAAMHVAGLARDIEGLAAIVALDQRDHLRRHPAFVEETADPERGMKAEGNFGHHVGELLLNELGRGERPIELLAVERILARPVPAIFRG